MSEPLLSSQGSHAAEPNQNHIATLSGAVNNASFPVAASADASGFVSDSGIEHTGLALQPMEGFMRVALDQVLSLPNSDAAPAGAPDAEPGESLPSAFLEPVRGDLGQRWVDVNVASAEDMWSMFCNPNVNGGCVFMLFFASF